MNLNFKPYVIREDINMSVVATAPSPITDTMWKILHNTNAIFDSGVYSMDRRNQTQFVFKVNPGYTYDTVTSVVAAGTYIAAVYTNLKDFWKYGWYKHYTEIGKVVDLPHAGDTRDSIHVFQVDEELFKLVYNAWIAKNAASLVDSAYDNNIRGRGINSLDFTQNRLDKALVMRNRLYFADLHTCGGLSGYLQKSKNLKAIDGYIRVLEKDHQQMQTLASQTDKVVESAKHGIEVLSTLLDTSTPAHPDAFKAWQMATEGLEDLSKEIQNIECQFNSRIGANALKAISYLVPPLEK